jgi:hypothetical protein
MIPILALTLLCEFYYPKGLNAKGLIRINPDLSVVGPKPAYFAAQAQSWRSWDRRVATIRVEARVDRLG